MITRSLEETNMTPELLLKQTKIKIRRFNKPNPKFSVGRTHLLTQMKRMKLSSDSTDLLLHFPHNSQLRVLQSRSPRDKTLF